MEVLNIEAAAGGARPPHAGFHIRGTNYFYSTLQLAWSQTPNPPGKIAKCNAESETWVLCGF